MKALVIDNETKVRQSLVNQLRLLVTDIDQVFEACGVESGLEVIHKVKPDIVFLDVEMDDGTGFDLIKRLKSYDFQLVFVTAFNKYAVNAFKLSAIDFLLKPVDEDELFVAVTKAKENITFKDLSVRISVMNDSLLKLHPTDQKIVLQDSKSMYFTKVNDICCCEAEGSYTTFYFINAEKIVVTKPIKEYELLLEPFGFIRTHHSFLVNKNRIQRFDKADGGILLLDNSMHIPVSQRKKEYVLNILSGKQ